MTKINEENGDCVNKVAIRWDGKSKMVRGEKSRI